MTFQSNLNPFSSAVLHRSHSEGHRDVECVFYLLSCDPDLLACFTRRAIIYNERHPEKVDKYISLRR